MGRLESARQPRHRLRVRALLRHLGAAALAAAPETDQRPPEREKARPKLRGQADPRNFPRGLKKQGYGIIGGPPPIFDTATPEGLAAAAAFYEEQGYVVVDALSEQDLKALNGVVDECQRDRGPEIDFPGQGQIFFPLPNFPEVDFVTQHPKVFPLVGRVFGGSENVRLVEFNWRSWPTSNPNEAGPLKMPFHPDTDGNTADGDVARLTRQPYGPPNFVSAFYYLTEVDEARPSFCVVPRSRRCPTLADAKEMLGEEYAEVPIRGKAGLCCIVDDATIHTRLDPDGPESKPRRIMHHVFARAGTCYDQDGTARPPAEPLKPNNFLFSRGLVPRRLALSEDPATRRLFSLWPKHQHEWAATGFAPDFASDTKSQRGPTPTNGPYKNPGAYKQAGRQASQEEMFKEMVRAFRREKEDRGR